MIQFLHHETLGKQQLILSICSAILQDNTVFSWKMQCNSLNETYAVSVLLQLAHALALAGKEPFKLSPVLLRLFFGPTATRTRWKPGNSSPRIQRTHSSLIAITHTESNLSAGAYTYRPRFNIPLIHSATFRSVLILYTLSIPSKKKK